MAVTDEAIDKIQAMISSAALRAGDRLPREADLAVHEPEVATSWSTVPRAGVEQWLASVP